ncbi:hypothetical protein COLO4_19818 [Corchorus olitorius]|uniref:Uncharacterized protein n=1 Tax=Corchorus olitorius TaxID=93759 RepID=A0A1R3J390_9ROSI|nr:hypothetical protein COLO4_19818 [Corchorus olitorius]
MGQSTATDSSYAAADGWRGDAHHGRGVLRGQQAPMVGRAPSGGGTGH